jgi:hypothetical protein
MSPPSRNLDASGSFHTKRRRGGVHRRQLELIGVDSGDLKRGVGGEMRREKSIRNDVHHADGAVWEPVYRTRLSQQRDGC